MSFDGKVALVIGGGSGIGRATAEVLAGRGARVAVADLNSESAMATIDLLRPTGHDFEPAAYQCDVAVPESVESLFDGVVRDFGKVDVVVSTVGWTDVTFFASESVEYWRKIVDVNLMGAFYIARSSIKYMTEQKSGAIVLTSSDAGKVGQLGETAYSAAKAGIIGFVKSLARELVRDGIRLNAIAPGPTDTPLLRGQLEDERAIGRMIRAVPMKRMAQPLEQANAIAFLASDEASYITGQTLSVSGGLTMSS